MFFIHDSLQRLGLFEGLEETDADHYAQTFWKGRSDRIVLITIDDADYRSLFKATSPLNSEKLIELIQAIRNYKPRVLGVDLLTGDWPPRSRMLGDDNPPVAWARDGLEESLSGVLIWNRVAGYAVPPATLCYAAPIGRPDPDGSVRHYSTSVHTQGSGSGETGIFPTLPVVLASSFPDKPLDCRSRPNLSIKRIKFTGPNHFFDHLRASDVLRDSSGLLRTHFQGKIAILGGTYAAARDQYASAGGFLSGLDILAHSVETELSEPVHEVPWLASALLNLGFSLLLYCVVFHLPWPLDISASIIAVALSSLIFGWLAYSLGYFLPIRSAWFGIPIGIIVEHCLECKILRHESVDEDAIREVHSA